jgi:hypothetical protein
MHIACAEILQKIRININIPNKVMRRRIKPDMAVNASVIKNHGNSAACARHSLLRQRLVEWYARITHYLRIR